MRQTDFKKLIQSNKNLVSMGEHIQSLIEEKASPLSTYYIHSKVDVFL